MNLPTRKCPHCKQILPKSDPLDDLLNHVVKSCNSVCARYNRFLRTMGNDPDRAEFVSKWKDAADRWIAMRNVLADIIAKRIGTRPPAPASPSEGGISNPPQES
jgi:hypothetical protein